MELLAAQRRHHGDRAASAAAAVRRAVRTRGDCKDTKIAPRDGRNGRLGSHLAWADLRRGWDFVSTGHGDVPWERCFRALTAIGYTGPISVEWEDAGMDRLVGAPEALRFVRGQLFDAPEAAFDAAFSAPSSGPSYGPSSGPSSTPEER